MHTQNAPSRLPFAGWVIVALAAIVVAAPIFGQQALYFALYQYQNGQLLTMGLDGSNPHTLFTTDPYPAADWLPVGLDLDGAGRIYWTNGIQPGTVRRANLDGSGQALVADNLKYPRGCAVDPVGGKVYWGEAPTEGNAEGIIRRQNLDGSGAIEEVFRINPYNDNAKVMRPFVDAANGYVYFGANGEVKRVNLDGPPFVVKTIATGGSTILRVIADVAHRQLYWIDTDTISDCVVRVDFDNENFTVLRDRTPAYFASSGLGDMAIDWTHGKIYLADEIPLSGNPVIVRCNLDGSNLETIYTAPDGAACVAMCFDTPNPPQPLEDCNHNGIADRIDIANGTSQDCNGNGIPDECEQNPCVTPNYLLDQGLHVTTALHALGTLISGGQPTTHWEIFQPFVVPAGGWNVGELRLNAMTWTYDPAGFTATFFPDNGSNRPDETQPLGSGTAFFRFAPTWVKIPVHVTLPAGQFWVRLTGNDNYEAGVYDGTSGLQSLSRRNNGSFVTGRPPIAMELLSPQVRPGDLNCDGEVNFGDINPFVLALSDPAGYAVQYPNCNILSGDINGDGQVNFGDINPFVALLSGE